MQFDVYTRMFKTSNISLMSNCNVRLFDFEMTGKHREIIDFRCLSIIADWVKKWFAKSEYPTNEFRRRLNLNHGLPIWPNDKDWSRQWEKMFDSLLWVINCQRGTIWAFWNSILQVKQTVSLFCRVNRLSRSKFENFSEKYCWNNWYVQMDNW